MTVAITQINSRTTWDLLKACGCELDSGTGTPHEMDEPFTSILTTSDRE
jgi:hypothetical protein